MNSSIRHAHIATRINNIDFLIEQINSLSEEDLDKSLFKDVMDFAKYIGVSRKSLCAVLNISHVTAGAYFSGTHQRTNKGRHRIVKSVVLDLESMKDRLSR